MYKRRKKRPTYWTQHQYGRAADITFIDLKTGKFPDINQDGRKSYKDKKGIFRIIKDRIDVQNPELSGYCYYFRGYYYHIDTRGYDPKIKKDLKINKEGNKIPKVIDREFYINNLLLKAKKRIILKGKRRRRSGSNFSNVFRYLRL